MGSVVTMSVQVAGRKLSFFIVTEGADPASFTCEFTSDGRTVHSARPNGTYVVNGLEVAISEENGSKVDLTFPKADVQVGDRFTGIADRNTDTFEVSQVSSLTTLEDLECEACSACSLMKPANHYTRL